MRRVLTAVGCAALMLPLLPATGAAQDMPEQGDLGMLMFIEVAPADRSDYREAIENRDRILRDVELADLRPQPLELDPFDTSGILRDFDPTNALYGDQDAAYLLLFLFSCEVVIRHSRP